jgi:hypothetical protein
LPLKVTTWNLEHSDRLVSATPSAAIVERRQRIRDTVEEIAPDILCIQEGPKGAAAVQVLSGQVFGGSLVPVLLPGASDTDYLTKGTQWIWFLARPELVGRCRLQAPSVWPAFTEAPAWKVNLWGQVTSSLHSHYRHPQVLIYSIDDAHELELIGVHLKSKINKLPPTRDANKNLTAQYVDGALEARIKLATEARDIRQYIGAKFRQLENPGIVVLGDCNDGPGHDFFEVHYLFFDLISNIQGEVLIAEQFFNHTLFDLHQDLRWTAKYADPVLEIPASRNPLLLDHILISQPLCNGRLPIVANPHAGLVEHQAYERHNAGAPSTRRTSDHRPASIVFSG